MEYYGKANTAKQRTEEETAKEKINVAIGSSIEQDGTLNVDDFEAEIKKMGGKITNKTEETITVEIDEYEAIIEIKSKKIIKFESTKGIPPKVEFDLFQENGNALVEGSTYEKVKLIVKVINYQELGKIDSITVIDSNGESCSGKEETEEGTKSFIVAGTGTYTITVKATTDGIQKEASIKATIKVAPEGWKITTKEDVQWYNYGNSKVNEPKLTGEMTPIKYIGEEQEGNKWANATTKDGSMFVWIPRYAYKITKGYHTTTAGTIEVAFLDKENNFLNGETGDITTNPEDSDAGISKWLVHPAFTNDAEYGGGFGELEGLWFGKFKTTGSMTNLSVKPAAASLVQKTTIKEIWKLAQRSTFGETVNLNSHMVKNSEWGATAYLAHSKYGTNAKKVENDGSDLRYWYTGGSTTKAEIYTTNKKQSTTHNATGVYDMSAGIGEYIATYVNHGGESLAKYGGTASGDLYGATPTERATSTPYKTVYEGVRNQEKDYETAKKYKGDAIYETSNKPVGGNLTSWFRRI